MAFLIVLYRPDRSLPESYAHIGGSMIGGMVGIGGMAGADLALMAFLQPWDLRR